MSRPLWEREGSDWPNRAASRFVVTPALRWHVQVMRPEAGDAPALLLLHGTGAATHSWRDLMPLLAERFTVVAPDLPGHGFTERPRGPMSLPAMARHVGGLLREMGVAPVMVVGHSAGAAIAIRMALDDIIRPRAIAAINGALLPFPGLAARLFPALAKMLFLNPLAPRLLALRARQPGEVARFLPRATGSQIDARGVALYGRLFASSAHCGAALAMMADWNLESFAADLPRLTQPLALLHGEQDSAIPIATARAAAARVDDGRLVSLPGLGHLAHEERPQEVAAIIRHFVGEHDGRTLV